MKRQRHLDTFVVILFRHSSPDLTPITRQPAAPASDCVHRLNRHYIMIVFPFNSGGGVDPIVVRGGLLNGQTPKCKCTCTCSQYSPIEQTRPVVIQRGCVAKPYRCSRSSFCLLFGYPAYVRNWSRGQCEGTFLFSIRPRNTK
jgi:hypothetical protein